VRVKVKLFAILREMADRDETILEVPNKISCEEILSRLQTELPVLGSVLEPCLVTINGRYVDQTTDVSEGDEVAVLPPVSGG
jgi:MoaD family protein